MREFSDDLLYKIQALSTINKSTNHISNVNTQPQTHPVGAREVGPIQMRETGTPISSGEPSGERNMDIQGSGRQGTPKSTKQLHIEPLGRIYNLSNKNVR